MITVQFMGFPLTARLGGYRIAPDAKREVLWQCDLPCVPNSGDWITLPSERKMVVGSGPPEYAWRWYRPVVEVYVMDRNPLQVAP